MKPRTGIADLVSAFDLDRYLKDRITDLRKRGEDEWNFNCPNCADHKHNMYANIKTKRFHCFRTDTCEWSTSNPGIIGLIQKLESCSFDDALQTIRKYTDSTPLPTTPKKIKSVIESHLLSVFDTPKGQAPSTVYRTNQLPEELMPLLPKTEYTSVPLAYLKQRGVSTKDILKYQLGYCLFGRYARCIIIPIFYHGKVVSFTARRLGKSGHYMKPFDSESWLFGVDFAMGVEYVVLVEGPFDAMQVSGKMGGRKLAGVALLGTNLTAKHIDLLGQGEWEKVIVALDKDASKKAIKMATRLQQEGFPASVCLMEKDPSDFSKKDLGAYLQKNTTRFRGNGWVEESIKAAFA